jgi:cytochrome c oxidase subunit 4
MVMFLELVSIVLGLVAWLLPLINLAVDNKAKNNNWMILSIASVSACATSLCMQLFINDSWDKSDWSYDYAVHVSLVLLVVTIALNVITVAIYRKYSVK